jgi:hypothetical protein
VRSRGTRSAQLEEQSDGIGSLWGVAWWLAAQRQGTARGCEAGDAWAAAPVAGAAVLNITREQQRSSGARWKSRAGWEWGASCKTWFLLDVKAGIRVAVDKVEHVASETVASVGLWAVEVDKRWHDSMAACGEQGDEATTRAFKRWVRLTRGPSPISISRFSNTQNLKSKMVTFLLSIIHQTLHSDSLKYKEQLCFLSQLQILSGLHVKNSGTNLIFEFSSNFKGIQTFLEKSDKFFKIQSSHGIFEYNFTFTHLYSNIRSFFTSGKNDSVIHTQCGWPLRDVGPSNTSTPLIQMW